ncbi:MAG: peptidoglycan-binding protein [Clostridia bacterium]|nr:peptidoglycan-binding protein [Clostridia bacterium]
MKSAKLALIALLIVLTLILGGCYVEPTNVSTNNQNGNDLNFPVYPSVTEIPAVPVTAAPTAIPNVQPISSSAQISLPTSVAGNFSTVAPMAPTSSAAKATVTPPVTATPSPTPQGSLKLGSTGTEVRNVQKKLKELGFYKGTVDGDFGEATEKAVKEFQKQYGLTVDGKVGSNTMAKLATARATAKPAVTPTKKPTATPAYSTNTYLRNGDSGAKVRQMQERLISLGYLVGKATSNFDNATEAGVYAFQRRHTSYADGVAGPETLKALYSSSATKTSSPSGIIGITLREGSKETEAVRLMQKKLKSLGYYKGSVDGSFGSGTTDAVKAFQRAHNLTADGVAGGGTFNKLFSSSAKTAAAAAATPTPKPTPTRTPTPKPTATPYRTPTLIPENTYVLVTVSPYEDYYATLRRGMYGTPVQQMQKALRELGYYSGVADGYFGEATENAVKSFQRSNGLEVDGVAGPATLRTLLYGAFPFGS